MDNSQVDAINDMLTERKSEDLLKESFSIFFIGKKNVLSRIIIILLGLILAVIISCLNTIEIMQEVTSVILDTVLTIFGIVFTGYAFFQALLNGQLVSVLINDVNLGEKVNRNTLHKTNWNFVQLMMQFLVAIFATVILEIILFCIPVDFCIFSQMKLNIIVSALLITIYFYHLMVIMWRMVSFIFNIYQLFNSFAVTKYLSFIKHKDDED